MQLYDCDPQKPWKTWNDTQKNQKNSENRTNLIYVWSNIVLEQNKNVGIANMHCSPSGFVANAVFKNFKNKKTLI